MTTDDIEQKINLISSLPLEEEEKSSLVSLLKEIKETYPNGISERDIEHYFEDQRMAGIMKLVWRDTYTGLFPNNTFMSFKDLFKS